MSDDDLTEVLAPICEKCSFLPSKVLSVPLTEISPLGELNVKTLSKLFMVFSRCIDNDYLAALCGRLPLKSMNILAEYLDDEVLMPELSQASASADLYLYIWKNRTKRTQNLLEFITIGSVVKVLNQNKLPKAWQSATRELKTMLMDKADFQGFLLESAKGDVKLITSALQAAHVLASGERQSLLVKFARLDRTMQDHIESGVGKQLVESAQGGREQQTESVEPLFSSVASIRRLRKELDDIINVQQPENRESLKAARAHGDFRENSEYDAAKERRNFLSRRRSELEKSLGQLQAINFSTIELGKHAIVGCEVTLTYQNGEQEQHYLLGAWDGNPDKRYLSYKTRLGEAIYHHEVGSTLDLPGGKRAVLSKIAPLPAEVIAEMDA